MNAALPERQGSKTFLHSNSFTPGFGDSAEAAATEHGKQGPKTSSSSRLLK